MQQNHQGDTPNNSKANHNQIIQHLKVEVEDLGVISNDFKRGSSSTIISFSNPQKITNYMSVKNSIGITIYQDGKEVFFQNPEHNFIDDCIFARGCYYYYEWTSGIYKVSIKPKISIECMIPKNRSQPIGKAIRECLGRRAILATIDDKNAMAVMLNNKGDKTQIFEMKGVQSGYERIQDLTISDHKNGAVSMLFTLGTKGSLLICILSRNCKILARNITEIPKLQEEYYDSLGASEDAKYVIVKVSNEFTLKVLRIRHHRVAEVKAVLSLQFDSKRASSLGFYPIKFIKGLGEEICTSSRLAYIVHQDENRNGMIDFFAFNTETGKLEHIEHLNGKFDLFYPFKAVLNQHGGNWIVTSGKSGKFARARIIFTSSLLDS